jgi:hypothetical protein
LAPPGQTFSPYSLGLVGKPPPAEVVVVVAAVVVVVAAVVVVVPEAVVVVPPGTAEKIGGPPPNMVAAIRETRTAPVVTTVTGARTRSRQWRGGRRPFGNGTLGFQPRISFDSGLGKSLIVGA